MKVELHLGDCLEVMRSMPDKSVDAVLDAADGDEDIARIAKHLCRLRSMSGVARRQGLAWRARLSFWLRWVCGWVKMEVNDANDA